MGIHLPQTEDTLQSVLAAVVCGVSAAYGARLLVALLLLAVADRIPRTHRWAVRCAPGAIRPILGRVLVGGLAGAMLTTPAAFAAPAQGCPGGGASGTTPLPVLDRGEPCRAVPTTPPGAADATASSVPGNPRVGPDTPQSRAPSSYQVQRGDSLWSISRTLLGAGASDTEVAGLWPRLWRANRGVVGDDPGLILPGMVLAIPEAVVGTDAP